VTGARRALIVAGLVTAGCGIRHAVPPYRADDARFGRLGGDAPPPGADVLCDDWRGVAEQRDPSAASHVSFPETNAADACFTPVHHAGREVRAEPPPRGCAFPRPDSRPRLEALAGAIERDDPLVAGLFRCVLAPEQRDAAIQHDVRALRALAARPAGTHPYAAVIVPGHGLAAQDHTALAAFVPGGRCRALAGADLARLGMMPARGARAADAVRGGVAPVVIATGGAVHSRVVEAFALMHLLACQEGIDPERIIVEPCADHTHTNLRNSGRWIDALGGRAGYIVTDDHVQSDYFQDFSGFELILGSIDQRSLRDWGYVIGSWRQASVGMNAGFWFTPYRFWAEPRDGLGSFTCVK
jgi:hypothetical protein